jgi:hypothetical protein
MKAGNMYLILFFGIGLSPTFVAAEDQTPKEPQNAISIGLIGPIDDVVELCVGSPIRKVNINMEYQRVISDHFVLFSTAGMLYWWPSPNASQDSEAILWYGNHGWFLMIGTGVEFDWHPFHKGLKGFYLGLPGIFNYKATYRDTATTKGMIYDNEIGLGLIVGWQFLLPASIIINLAVGYGYGYIADVDVNGVTSSHFSFVEPRGGISLGFRF